jgi:hypothetical protein
MRWRARQELSTQSQTRASGSPWRAVERAAGASGESPVTGPRPAHGLPSIRGGRDRAIRASAPRQRLRRRAAIRTSSAQPGRFSPSRTFLAGIAPHLGTRVVWRCGASCEPRNAGPYPDGSRARRSRRLCSVGSGERCLGRQQDASPTSSSPLLEEWL